VEKKVQKTNIQVAVEEKHKLPHSTASTSATSWSRHQMAQSCLVLEYASSLCLVNHCNSTEITVSPLTLHFCWTSTRQD